MIDLRSANAILSLILASRAHAAASASHARSCEAVQGPELTASKLHSAEPCVRSLAQMHTDEKATRDFACCMRHAVSCKPNFSCRMPTHEEEEVVVLMRVLSHEVNYGYEAPVVFMVRTVQVPRPPSSIP